MSAKCAAIGIMAKRRAHMSALCTNSSTTVQFYVHQKFSCLSL